MRDSVRALTVPFLLCLCAVGICVSALGAGEAVLLAGATLANFHLAWINRRNQPVVVFFIFTLTYILYILPFYLFGIRFTAYLQYATEEHFAAALQVLALFLVVLYCFQARVRPRGPRAPFAKLVSVLPNDALFLGSLLFMVAITFLGIRGDTIFAAGGYGKGSVQKSGLVEYFLIGLVLAAATMRRPGRLRVAMLGVVVVAYVLRILVYGGRIEVLQVILVLFFVFADRRFSGWMVVAGSTLGLGLTELVGLIRANPLQALSALSYGWTRPAAILSNQGDVFYASTAYIAVLRDGMLDPLFRVKSIVGFLASLVLPSRAVWPEARVAEFVSRLTPIGGGGLFPAYLFLWLGVPGVIFGAWIVHRLICASRKDGLPVWARAFVVLALSTYPRWYAYSPIVLAKLCVWGALAVAVSRGVHRSLVRTARAHLLGS